MKIHGKEITTIVSDLDGTLLGEEKTNLNPLVYDLILSFKERGVNFVAASGRTYKNMKSLFAPVLDDISLICENGSLKSCPSSARTSRKRISRKSSPTNCWKICYVNPVQK